MKKNLFVFVVIVATIFVAGCAPRPQGKLVFQDLYHGNEIQLLDMNPTAEDQASISPLHAELGSKFLGTSGNDLVFEQIVSQGQEWYVNLVRYSPATGESVILDYPALPFDLTDLSAKNAPNGNLYIAFRHFELDDYSSRFAVYRLDGVKFTFVRSIDFKKQVYLYPVRSNNADLSKMVVEIDSFGPYELYDSATDTFTRLEIQDFPVFSPDGEQMVYETREEQGFCLVTLPVPNPTAQTTVFCNPNNPEGQAYDLIWSPDGKRIAVTYTLQFDYPEPMQLTVIDAVKSKVVFTTDPIEFIRDLTWSPDGNFLAYYAEPEKNPGFFTIKADGTGLTRVYSQPNWSHIYTDNMGMPFFPFWIAGWIK